MNVGQALRKAGIRPTRVVMGLPRASVILRTLTLPKTGSEGEMASMVQFQIGKDLPFRQDEAVIDFKIQAQPIETVPVAPGKPDKDGAKLAAPAEDKVQVLVAAVKKDVVLRLQELARAGGFRLASIGLRSYANARCARLCGMESEERCLLLVSLRPDEVVIDILLDGELAFSRVASLPSPPQEARGNDNPATKGENTAPTPPKSGVRFPVDAVVMEVVRSLHSYEGMENHGQAGRILVAGIDGEPKRVAEALGKHLKLPVEVLDPAPALGLKGKGSEQASAAMAAFGLAFGMQDDGGLPFDFLNPKRPAPPAPGKRVRILAAAAAASILFCLLAGTRVYMLGKRTALKNAIQQEVTAASKSLPLYRQTIAQARTIKSWVAEEKPWLDHLAYLSSVLPPCEDLYATSIATGDKGSVHLLVKARHGEVITRLDALLREAGYDVRPPAITPSGDRFGYAFQATLELNPTDRLKIDLAKLQWKPRPEDDASMEPPAGRGGGGPGRNRKGNRGGQGPEGRGQ
jgi:Tfp pilus assembly PilM family ATPase